MRWLVVAAALLVACGRGEAPKPAAAAATKVIPPPSIAGAQKIVAESPEFSEYQFTYAAVSLPMKTTPVSRDNAQQLAAVGWARLHGDELELTQKAKSDKRFIVRPNATVDVVPLAKKEFGTVTEVKAKPDGTVDATFTWKWIPNEVGAAFTRGELHERYAAPQRATATLMWDGSAWSVLRITPQ